VGFVRRHPLLSALLGLGLGIVLLLGVTAFAVWRAAHTDDARRIDRVDAIVVLGAAQYNGRPSPVFADRLDQAALLFRQDRAPVIVTLGAGGPGDTTTEAEAGKEYLVGKGVPEADIVAVSDGSTTFQSLEAAAGYFRQSRMDSAFLVSDPWHNLRIKRMFGDLGMRAFASATFHSAARSMPTRLAGYARETFAYLYYRLFGGD